ncbi:Global transcription regulator sge1 [Entomophthora muscae]|uniref:Global transcription regulator sge1 n=1 Tax=Entomophthora muscae TaxID=34485 RepID=A0ACC2RMW8_9FUNG|nr:Global transcription regulator sge1 [Entomophthora muscae]
MRYVGSIRNVNDAFVIAELAIRGHHPLETKRPNLPAIIPGSVFVYVKEEGVMERWVDGRSWAPSRFSRGFFVYHERRVSVERLLQRVGAQFYIRHNGSTLTKRVITIISPSGSTICVVAYSEDSQAGEQDVVSFAHSLGITDLHDQIIKYKYYKNTTRSNHAPSCIPSPMKRRHQPKQPWCHGHTN